MIYILIIEFNSAWTKKLQNKYFLELLSSHPNKSFCRPKTHMQWLIIVPLLQAMCWCVPNDQSLNFSSFKSRNALTYLQLPRKYHKNWS